MKFILIILFLQVSQGHPPAGLATTAEFDSRDTCIAAAQAVRASSAERISVVCVQK
jgi:hypothetical protein